MQPFWMNKKPMRGLLVGLLSILALSACNFPRPTPTPNPGEVATHVADLLTQQAPSTPLVVPTLPATATPAQPTPLQTQAPTPSPSPSATPNPNDPRLSLGDPTWSADFQTGKSFLAFQDEHIQTQLDNGVLLMTAFNPDSWYGWTLANKDLQNFYVEITAKTETCSGLDRYGVIARTPDGTQGYFFGFSCDGRYQVRKWDGNQFTNLTEWTADPAILSGSDQTNRLGLMANGANFTLYANGKLLGEVQDATYPSGDFGLFIASAETPNFTVQVSAVSYWSLP